MRSFRPLSPVARLSSLACLGNKSRLSPGSALSHSPVFAACSSPSQTNPRAYSRTFSTQFEDKEGNTHFGFQTVRADEKAKMVGEVFSKVAERYDVMNDFMSGGMHRLWKDQLVASLGPVRGTTMVDLAGGTGDVAFRILKELGAQRPPPNHDPHSGEPDTRLIVCDINGEMLGEGRRRAQAQGLGVEGVSMEWVQGDAETLPFPDRSVDCVTIAFGLRNVTQPKNALKDAHRVLKRGGRFMCMEFSQVKVSALREMYDAYSFNVIPALGAAVAGDAQPYQYLVESIRKFPDQETLAAHMREAGMEHVSYTDIMGGIVALHSGFRMD